MIEADKDDKSLEKYKAGLLGDIQGIVVIDEDNPRNVIIRWLSRLIYKQGRIHDQMMRLLFH